MQIYKTFFKIVKKNIFQILMYVTIVLGVTIAMIAATSSKEQDKLKQEKYNIVVVNHDDSEISRELCGYLEKIHNVKKENYTKEQIIDRIFYEKILTYIEIPRGFGEAYKKNGENRIESTYDDNKPIGMFINMQIENYLNSVRQFRELGYSFEEAVEKSNKSLDVEKYVEMQSQESGDVNTTKMIFNFLPYGILNVIFLGILPVFGTFNEEEKRNKMQVSGLSVVKKNIALLLGAATLALLMLVVFDTSVSIPEAGKYLFSKTWFLAIGNTVIYTISISMLGFFVSCFMGVNTATASVAANVIGLGFSFIGGTFVPLEILGDKVKTIGKLIPNYWYSTANESIFNAGSTSRIMTCFGMQLVFGVMILCVGLVVSKIVKSR